MVQSATEDNLFAIHLIGDGTDINTVLGVRSGGLHQRKIAIASLHVIGFRFGGIFQSFLNAFFGIITVLKAQPRAVLVFLLFCNGPLLCIFTHSITVKVAHLRLIVAGGIVLALAQILHLGEG